MHFKRARTSDLTPIPHPKVHMVIGGSAGRPQPEQLAQTGDWKAAKTYGAPGLRRPSTAVMPLRLKFFLSVALPLSVKHILIEVILLDLCDVNDVILITQTEQQCETTVGAAYASSIATLVARRLGKGSRERRRMARLSPALMAHLARDTSLAVSEELKT